MEYQAENLSFLLNANKYLFRYKKNIKIAYKITRE